MIHVSETSQAYLSLPVQTFIENECKKPHKQWIYAIIDGQREQQSIIYTDPAKRFVILPSVPDPRRRHLSYLAIFSDTSLRSIRDLRGEHVRLLIDVCTAAASVLPDEFAHASFHYHPSVYQLHMHFRHPKDVDLSNPRIYTVGFVILCLAIKPDFFQTCTLKFRAHGESALVRSVQQHTLWDPVAVSKSKVTDGLCDIPLIDLSLDNSCVSKTS